MPVLCATDLSVGGDEAVRAAAAIAARLRTKLTLLHVIETPAVPDDSLIWSLKEKAEGILRSEVSRIRGLGVEVEHVIATGPPDEEILKAGVKSGAGVIVISPAGKRERQWFGLGSTAERVVRRATIPVLVVRDASCFEAWAAGSRSLKVLVGADFSRPAELAVSWIGLLRRAGPVDLILTHVYLPPAERVRLGLGGPAFSVDANPEVEMLLTRDLTARFGSIPGAGEVRMRFVAGTGSPADHILRTAQAENVDLVLMGTHQREGLSRLWHGSVAAGVLAESLIAVAVVPAAAGSETPPEIPGLRRVLVTTDLSREGDRAVPWAWSILAGGGVVHLMHVIEVEVDRVSNPLYKPWIAGNKASPEERADLARLLAGKLNALVPEGAAQRGVETRLEVVEGQRVAETILQNAARLGVDAIVTATHGRSGLSRTLLGSVAEHVVREAEVPVFVVRPRREG